MAPTLSHWMSVTLVPFDAGNRTYGPYIGFKVVFDGKRLTMWTLPAGEAIHQAVEGLYSLQADLVLQVMP